MTLAVWMVLAAAMLPYACAIIAKAGDPGFDNAAPRRISAARRWMRWNSPMSA